MFKQKEIKSYKFLKSLGWKQILINSPRNYLPKDNIIIEEFNNALKDFKDKFVNHYIINIGIKNEDAIYGKLTK